MNLQQLSQFSGRLSATDRMPALFLGHGSPMNAIEENQFVQGFRDMAGKIEKPKAILCISAHWYTSGTFLMASENPETIHDFSGFPKALFDVEYPAKGDPALAAEVAGLLEPFHAETSENWGLDHGAWSVLRHMYPHAEIPVIQMSIDYTQPPEYHFELAQRLQQFREKGILIVGSGNIVHNLRMIDWRNINTPGAGWDWALEARERINGLLLNGDFKPLLEYQKQGISLQYAIPTPDHFLPLIYTLGLKNDAEELSLFNDELIGGSLSMTSVLIR